MKRKLKKFGKVVLLIFIFLVIVGIFGWFYRVQIGRGVFNLVLKETSKYDLIHYDVYAKTNNKEGTISIRTDIELKSKIDNLRKVLLFLIGNFKIEKVNKNKNLLKFINFKIPIPQFKIQILIITLDKPVAKSKNYSFSISYSGKSAGDAFINKDGAELNGGVPWTPFSINDSFTTKQIINVPKDQYAVATGELVKVIENKDNKTYIYEANSKQQSICFSSYKFKKITKNCNGINVCGYFSSDDDYKKYSKKIIDDICFAINLYSKYFGPYAFKNFYFIQTTRDKKGTNYGGTGLIIIPRGNFKYYFKKTKNIEKFYYILFHEISHNWFGSTVESKIIQSRWLEILAETSMIFAFEKRVGNDITQKWIVNSLFGYIDEIEKSEKSLNDLFFLSQSRIVYDKGLLVFRMLRYILSDEVFFKVLKEFYTKYKFKQTVWQDLKKVTEEVSKRDLDWFFHNWMMTTKKLDYELYNVKIKKENNYYLTSFKVRNVGEIEMTVDIELLIETKDKKEIKKIKIEKQEKEYIFKTKHPVTKIVIDPNYWMLDINRYNDTYSKRGNLGIKFDILDDKTVNKMKLNQDKVWTYVKKIEKNSPAEKYGLKEKDIVIKINGKEINYPTMLRYELWNTQVGDDIKLDIIRDKKKMGVNVGL